MDLKTEEIQSSACHQDHPYYEMQRQQTRFFIEKALFECLQMTSWPKLTIGQVCRQAQISRKTFYRYYSSLSGCIEMWFKAREQEYLQKAARLDRYDLNQIAHEFFAFWKPYQKQLALLEKAGFPLEQLFFPAARRIIQKRAGAGVNENLIVFSGGGFFALWKKWISQLEAAD